MSVRPQQRVKKKRDSTPVDVLLIKGTGSSARGNRQQDTPPVELSETARQELSAFVSSLQSSDASLLRLSAASASLPLLLSAASVQDQVDALQQTFALSHAYGLIDSQAAVLSPASRRLLAACKPQAAALAPLAPEEAAGLRAALLRPLLSLLLHPVVYPRILLIPLFMLLSALSSPASLPPLLLPFVLSLPSSASCSRDAQQALAVLELGLEWDGFVQAMQPHTPQLIAWLVSLLRAIVHQHKARWDGAPVRQSAEQSEDAEEEEEGGEVGEEMVASDRELLCFMRVLVPFVLRLRPQLHRSLCDPASGPALLLSLLGCLSSLLQSETAGKDPLTQSALLIVVLVHCPTASEEQCVDALQRLFFSPAASLTASPQHPVLAAYATLFASSLLQPDWFARCSPPAHLAVCRAILTQSSPALLLHPLPQPGLSGSDGELSPAAGAHCLYFSHCFPLLLSICHSTSPRLRCAALRCLDVWLSMAPTIVQASSAASRASVSSAFSRCWPTVLSLLSLNWEHPYRPVIAVNRQLFSQLIKQQLGTAAQQPAPTPSSSSLLSLAAPLVASILSRHDRGAYHMVDALLPHIGSGGLLSLCPSFIPHALQTAKWQPRWGLVATVLQRLLTLAMDELRQEEEERRHERNGETHEAAGSELRAEKRGDRAGRLSRSGRRERQLSRRTGGVDAAVADSAASPEVLQCWRSLWLPAVAERLLDDDAQVRQAVSGSLVIFCLNLDPLSLPAVIARIMQTDAAASQSAAVGTPAFPQLRALMSVLVAARRAGLISSELLHRSLQAHAQPAATSNGCSDGDGPHAAPLSLSSEGRLPLSRALLLSCLLHADVELRLETVEFVCSNLYQSELPSESELGLLQAAFPFIIKMGEPTVRLSRQRSDSPRSPPSTPAAHPLPPLRL